MFLQGGQAAEGAVQAADAQQYAAAMAASSGLAPPEAAPMHPGMTEAYQLPVRSCGRLCIKPALAIVNLKVLLVLTVIVIIVVLSTLSAGSNLIMARGM